MLSRLKQVDVLYSPRRGFDDLGADGSGGVTGTITLHGFMLIMKLASAWFMHVRGKLPVGFFDVGSLGGRMLFLSVALRWITYAAGVEINGKKIGRTRSSNVLRPSGLEDTFHAAQQKLSWSGGRVRASFDTDVSSLTALHVHHTVNQNLILYLFFEGQLEGALLHSYQLAARPDSGVQMIITLPHKGFNTSLGAAEGILEVLGHTQWQLLHQVKVNVVGGKSEKTVHIFARRTQVQHGYCFFTMQHSVSDLSAPAL